MTATLEADLAEAAAVHADGRSDVALVAAYRQGDARALDTLVLRHQARLRGMCFRYLRDATLAEDFVQEAFCQLLSAIGRVDAGFNVGAWLHRVAANLCLDELRRRSRRAPLEVGDDPDLAAAGARDTDRTRVPHEALEITMTGESVRAAVARVPARQRDVLLLRDVRGLSQERVARLLGLPPGAVQGILHRARERFKTEFVALEGSPGQAPECGKASFVLENLGRSAVRLDRLRSVERHVFRCASCRGRFGASVLRTLPGGRAPMARPVTPAVGTAVAAARVPSAA